MTRSTHRSQSAVCQLTSEEREEPIVASSRTTTRLRIPALVSVLAVAGVVGGLDVPAAHAQIACNNDSFRSSVAGGFLPNAPTPDYLDLDKTPQNYPGGFIDDSYCTGLGCFGEPRYKLYATFNNITQWRGKVCATSVENTSNTHWISYQTNYNDNCPSLGPTWCTMYVGPEVGFQYRGSDNVWRWLESDNGTNANWEIPANQTRWYHWWAHFNAPTDFRIVVRYAKPNDRFDLMMDK